MLTDEDKKIWKKVCTTVTPLGEPLPNTKSPQPKIKTDLYSLDLHNHSLDDAYNKTIDIMNRASDNNIKIVEIITGRSCYPDKSSIRSEFPMWMETNIFSNVKNVKKINDGSFILTLK